MREKTEALCAGCEKPLGSSRALICLAPGLADRSIEGTLVEVHAGRYRDLPSDKCLRAARARNPRCPGCGGDDSKQGELCDDCRTVLDRGRDEAAKPAASRALAWYAIDTGGLFPYAPEGRDLATDADDFGKLLVQLAASGGRVRGVFHAEVPSYPRPAIISAGSNWRNEVHSGMTAVELYEHQVVALKEIMVKWTATAHGLFRAGIRQGHTNLVRLAQGEISPKEFDGLSAKAAENNDD